MQQVQALALGKLVKIQHCPRNGKNEKHINEIFFKIYATALKVWEGGYANINALILHLSPETCLLLL